MEMEYEPFENKLLVALKNNADAECFNLIEDNKKLIQLKLQNKDNPVYIDRLINNLNDIILQVKNFNLIEIILSYDLFSEVLSKFKKSDILIKACKMENIEAIHWLLTMNIDKYVQDQNGMTALMHAAEHSNLLSVVKTLVQEGGDSIYLTDNRKETVLFHALKNLDIFYFIADNTKFDINQVNCYNESAFIYACKHDIEVPRTLLVSNPNIMDNDGKTGPMYLIEHERYKTLLNILTRNKQFDYNLRNERNEGFFSLFIKKYYDYYTSKDFLDKFNTFIQHVNLLKYLCTTDCDFNSSIDEYGNTPLMFFLLIKDYSTALYILLNVKNLDLSVKNKHGINACYLYFFVDENNDKLKRVLFNHKTFDYTFIDKYNNNLLMHSIVREKYRFNNIVFTAMNLVKHEKLFNKVNDRKENFIIVATKLNCLKNIDDSYMDKIDINQQDYLGNTALFYAVKLNDLYAINKLAFYHADPSIKNNEGVSVLDLVHETKKISELELDDEIKVKESIIGILNHSVPPKKFGKKKKGKKGIFSSLKKSKDTNDEKVEEYIKIGQVKNYQKEYDYMLVNPETSYTPPEQMELKLTKLYSAYFPEADIRAYGLVDGYSVGQGIGATVATIGALIPN